MRTKTFGVLPIALILCLGLVMAGCGKKDIAPANGQEILTAGELENGAGGTGGGVAEASTAATFEFELDTGGGDSSQAPGSDDGKEAEGSSGNGEETATADGAEADAGSEQTADISMEPEAEAGQEQETGAAVTDAEESSPALDAAGLESTISEDGSYTSKEDVALYIHTYGRLPSNFITKKEAKKLGWSGGSLEEFAPGKCIGGDYFGNYEGLLPENKDYRECDIDTLGRKKRGPKRIIYSDDGYIYYTGDHYESFELLYEP